MRLRFASFVLMGLALFGAPLASFASDGNAFVQGFGGLRLGTMATTDTSFGAVVGGNLIPSIQVVGEAGRIGDVLPNTVGTLLSFSPVPFHLAAWYGQGGVRFTTPGSSALRPYFETAAGFAHLQNQFGAFGSPLADTFTNIGLRFLDRTEPITTIGGGVMIRGGSFVADFGYRYRRIFASDLVDALLTGGRLDTNEVRVGVGFRF